MSCDARHLAKPVPRHPRAVHASTTRQPARAPQESEHFPDRRRLQRTDTASACAALPSEATSGAGQTVQCSVARSVSSTSGTLGSQRRCSAPTGVQGHGGPLRSEVPLHAGVGREPMMNYCSPGWHGPCIVGRRGVAKEKRDDEKSKFVARSGAAGRFLDGEVARRSGQGRAWHAGRGWHAGRTRPRAVPSRRPGQYAPAGPDGPTNGCALVPLTSGIRRSRRGMRQRRSRWSSLLASRRRGSVARSSGPGGGRDASPRRGRSCAACRQRMWHRSRFGMRPRVGRAPGLRRASVPASVLVSGGQRGLGAPGLER